MKSAPRDSPSTHAEATPGRFRFARPAADKLSICVCTCTLCRMYSIDVLRGRHGSNKARKRIYIKYCRVAALRVRQNIAFLYTLSIGCRCVIRRKNRLRYNMYMDM